MASGSLPTTVWRPAADLDKPDLWCLAKGVYADDHIYAGGQGLFETDLGVQGVPILNWREIPLTYSSSALGVVTLGGGGGPTTIRTVYRIAVLREDRRIVIAREQRVLVRHPRAAEEHTRMPLDAPRPSHADAAVDGGVRVVLVNKAVGLPDVEMDYLGLAAGPPRRGKRERSIAVASWGEPGRAAEFYWGEWEGGQLVMHPAKVQQDLGRVWARATTMASCEHHPERMYAISSNDEGFPYALWRSFDAGRSWEPVEPKMVKTPGLNPPHLKFPAAAGNSGITGCARTTASPSPGTSPTSSPWAGGTMGSSSPRTRGRRSDAPTSPGTRTPTCMACASTRPILPVSGSTPQATAVC